jgi:acetyl esterase/lipase
MIGLDDRYLKDAGVDPKRIKALVGLAGPYDFLPLTDKVAIRTFGDSKDLDATQPTTYVNANSPPTFLATGEADNIVYPRNTTRLARKFRDAGATVEERHYPGVGHISIVLALSRPLRGQAPVLDELTTFLREHVAD